ncbi:MAG: HAD family phosphatase [Ignavibacteriaceae bacterium]
MRKADIEVLVFDLGNVLIPFDHQIMVRRFNEIHPGLGEIFIDRYYKNYNIHRDFERGKIPENEFIGIMLEWLENKIDADSFCRIYSDIFSVNNQVVSLLPVLKTNYKLILLSNTNSIHQKYGWQKYNFLNEFDELVLSHQAGAVKPEEKIYKVVEKISGSEPERHLFIDDIKEYVEAAISMGWNGIVFQGNERLITDFKLYDIKFDQRANG